MTRTVTITLPAELAAELLERAGSEAVDQVYGGFMGGDPRDFVPDEDCSSPEEREAHRVACEAWSRGEGQQLPASSTWEVADNTVTHSTRNYFGLGVNTLRDPVMAALATALHSAMDGAA